MTDNYSLLDNYKGSSENSDPYSLLDNYTPSSQAPKPAGAFTSSVASTLGSGLSSKGRALEDFSQANNLPVLQGLGAKMRGYGDEVVTNNPLPVNSLSDVVDKPVDTVKQAVGNAAAFLPENLAAQTAGRVIGTGLGAAATAFFPPAAPLIPILGTAGQFAGGALDAALNTYGGIRDTQDKNHIDDKQAAVVGSLGSGAIEQALGANKFIGDMVLKRGAGTVAERIAAGQLIPEGQTLGSFVKQQLPKTMFKQGKEEGGEELLQSPIEQYAGGDDPLTKQSLEQTGLGGVMGAIGGSVMSGAAVPFTPRGPLSRAASKAPPLLKTEPEISDDIQSDDGILPANQDQQSSAVVNGTEQEQAPGQPDYTDIGKGGIDGRPRSAAPVDNTAAANAGTDGLDGKGLAASGADSANDHPELAKQDALKAQTQNDNSNLTDITDDGQQHALLAPNERIPTKHPNANGVPDRSDAATDRQPDVAAPAGDTATGDLAVNNDTSTQAAKPTESTTPGASANSPGTVEADKQAEAEPVKAFTPTHVDPADNEQFMHMGGDKYINEQQHTDMQKGEQVTPFAFDDGELNALTQKNSEPHKDMAQATDTSVQVPDDNKVVNKQSSSTAIASKEVQGETTDENLPDTPEIQNVTQGQHEQEAQQTESQAQGKKSGAQAPGTTGAQHSASGNNDHLASKGFTPNEINEINAKRETVKDITGWARGRFGADRVKGVDFNQATHEPIAIGDSVKTDAGVVGTVAAISPSDKHGDILSIQTAKGRVNKKVTKVTKVTNETTPPQNPVANEAAVPDQAKEGVNEQTQVGQPDRGGNVAQAGTSEPQGNKEALDAEFNVSGKYPEKGIGFKKGLERIISDGEYTGKRVSADVRLSANKLQRALLDGDALTIQKLAKKYFPEWNKSKSKAGTQRDRFVPINTAKIELHRIANAAANFLNKNNETTNNVQSQGETTYERAERFKGIQAGVDAARNTLASISLGKKFGQTLDAHLSENPDIKRMYDRAKSYITEKAQPSEAVVPDQGEGEVSDKSSFAVERVENNNRHTLTFAKGDDVKIAGLYPMRQGKIIGISKTKKQVNVGGVWHDYGYVYKPDYDEYASHRNEIDSKISSLRERLDSGNSIEASQQLDEIKKQVNRFKFTEYSDKIRELEVSKNKVERDFEQKLKSNKEAKQDDASRKVEEENKRKAEAAPDEPIKMTMKEWGAIHRDFKGKLPDGSRSVMHNGTIQSVEIVKQHEQANNKDSTEQLVGQPDKGGNVAETGTSEDGQAVSKARAKEKVKPAVKRKSTVNDSDHLLAAIAKLGGISANEAKAQGIDQAAFKLRGSGIMRVFHNSKNADSYDGMAENLRQYGFDIHDANDLVDKASRAVNQGEKIYNAVGHELHAAAEAQEEFNSQEVHKQMQYESLLETAKQHDNDFGTDYVAILLKKEDMTTDDLSTWEQDLHDDRNDRHEESLASSQEAIPGETELGSYTETELAAKEREQAQRAKQAAAAELKAKKKDAVDRGVDDVANAFMGKDGSTENVFGFTAMDNIELGKAEKNIPTTEPKGAVADKSEENKTLLEAHKSFNDKLDSGDITANELKASFEKLINDKDAAYAELNKLTKDVLAKKYIRGYVRNDATKADFVRDAYRGMLADYKIADGMISYGMGKDGYLNAIRKFVDGTTDTDIKGHAEQLAQAKSEHAERKVEIKAGMENPVTGDDFTRIMRVRIDENEAAGMTRNEAFNAARMAFTQEQRAQYDNIVSDLTRSKRAEAKTDQQKSEVRVAAQTTEGQIVETSHTKTGTPLFVVKTADRVERDIYNHWNATAKRLGGYYSSFRGAGAVPGFQFKTRENADAFLKFLGGDVADAKEMVQARRDSFADDRSQTAVERLNEMADRLEEKADESLGRDRKANTHKRAGEAARAESYAQADKAMAATMRNIASAIQTGTAKLLDRVRQKVQVEMLQSFVHTAQYDKLIKDYPSYGDQQKHQGEKPTKETADYATFPVYSAMRSNIASIGRALLENEGTKKLGQQIMKQADDVSDAYLKFAKENTLKVSTFSTHGGAQIATFASKPDAEKAISRSGFKGKAIVLPLKRGDNRIILSPSEAINRGIWQGDDKVITLDSALGAELVEKLGKQARRGNKITAPWQFENAYEKRKRLAAMGIETAAELRAALREFIGLRESPKAADKIKEMERAMIGRANDGLDFFPTPAGIADQMIESADIKEGMSVLEPSAGMGHIAERIREAGAEPDVVELSNSRKELLEAKGFNVVGRDFMEMNPRGYTWGDTFKAEDGKVGTMQMTPAWESGSPRRSLVGEDGKSLGYYDIDELTPVKKNGGSSGYDRIIMNPPFGDRRDAEHVYQAYELLKPGGRLVAIMGEGVFFGSDKKAVAFRDWLEEKGGTEEKLPDGSFLDPSLPVNTGVNARLVVIDKPEGGINSSGDDKFSQSSIVPTDAAPTGITEGQANVAIENFKRDLNGAKGVTFKIYANEQEAFGDGYDTKKRVKGFYRSRSGTIGLIRSSLNSMQDAIRTLRHETLAHFGINLLAPGDKAALLGDIVAAKRNPFIGKVFNQVKKEYPELANDEFKQAEEVFARIAEEQPTALQQFIDKILLKFVRALRSIGLVKGIATKAELRDMLKSMAEGIRRGDTQKTFPKNNQSQFSKTNSSESTERLDADNNDIRYSRAGDASDSDIIKEAKRKAGLGPKKTITKTIQDILSRGIDANKQAAKAWWAELQPRLEQGLFDKFYGIKLAEKEILGDVAHSLSGYISARLSTGSSSTMQALLLHGAPQWSEGIIQKKDDSKGFAEILQPVKDDLENFTAWMVGRRADRLFKEGKENNFSRDEIDALLGLKQDSYQGVADDIADMNKSVLDLAQDAGLVDPESRKLFENNDYIPFYRLIEGKKPGPSKKGGLSHQTSGIKMLKGGDNPMSDPLGNMMQNWAHLIDASMKNDALNKTLVNLEGSRFTTAIPSVEFKQALIPKEQIKKLMLESGLPKEAVDLMPTELTSGIAKLWQLQAPVDPDVVKVMRGGKSEYYKVNDAMLLTSLSAVNQMPFGGIFKPMRYMKSLLTAAVTADPTFMARNFIRDSMHSWTIAEEKGFKFGIDSFHGAVKSFNEEGGYIDMMFAGASFQGGYGNYNNPDSARTSMDAALRRKGIKDVQGFKDSILDTPKKYWEMYRSVGDAIENANREATLENAKRSGAEKARYLFEAKDLMDFSMQGSFTMIRAMSDMLPFFNARLVGLYRLAKAGKTPEARKMILAKGLSIAMFSLALLALNADNDDYEELEDWDKDQYWHFFFGDQHFRIPKPFELGLVFGTIPERSARALMGKDSVGKYAERMGHGVSDTLAFNPIPQLLKPFVELYSNKNMFTGRAIEGMADEGKLPSARYNEYTSETMRALSSSLPEALGASPKRLEHLMHGYLGALGMYALGASDMMVRGLSGMPELPSSRMDSLPVLKAFYQEKPTLHTKYGTEFYDMLSEVNQLHKTINAYQKEGNTEKASELMADNADKLRSRHQLESSGKQLSKLRAQVDVVYRSNLSASDKRSKIDALMQKSNDVARNAVQKSHAFFN